MSLDLTVCPIREPRHESWYAYNRMRLDSDDLLFRTIGVWGRYLSATPATPKRLPPGMPFYWHDESGCKPRVDDYYGWSLSFIYAKEFMHIPTHIVRASSVWNAAVFAMLQQLPPATPVVLFWH